MNKANRRNALRLNMQAAELMLATPQVVTHRLARMMTAGAGVSSRDQREFHRMSAEKFAAFGESWNDMALQMVKANQQMARAFMFGSWFPVRASSGAGLYQSFYRAAAQMQSSTLQVINSGVAPVRKCAMANAKRLRRVKTR